MIFVLAKLQVILFGWVLGTDNGVEEAERGAAIRLPRIFGFVIKYVSPVYLITIFVLWCREKLPEYVKNLSEGGVPLMTLFVIIAVLVLFLILVRIAGKRWDEQDATTN